MARTSSRKSARGPNGKGPRGRGVAIVNQEEARKRFGLTEHAFLQAIDRGDLDPFQVNGSGRPYYSVKQLEALARRLTTSYSIAA